MFVYRNGVYYIDSLQEAVEAQGDNKGDDSEQIYISIPEDGMNLQRIFLSRCTIIRQIIKEIV